MKSRDIYRCDLKTWPLTHPTNYVISGIPLIELSIFITGFNKIKLSLLIKKEKVNNIKMLLKRLKKKWMKLTLKLTKLPPKPKEENY